MTFRCYVALLLAFSSVGCVTFQDCEYSAAQKLRAHRAWWFGCDERCTYNPFSHYASGWRKGYADVLLGGDGECPPVPPQCYWSHKFQSERGECAIENWFLGYSQGAAEALATSRNRYHNVPISNTFRECGPGCLPTDHSPYDFGRTGLGIKHSPPRLQADAEDEEDSGSPSIPQAPPSAAKDSPTPQMENEPGPGNAPAPSEPAPVIAPEVPPSPESMPTTPSSTESESTFRSSAPAGKWTRSASMTKKWSHSMFAKLTGNTEQN